LNTIARHYITTAFIYFDNMHSYANIYHCAKSAYFLKYLSNEQNNLTLAKNYNK